MANTTATLALCALSMGDYSAAADFSRCHLKLFGNPKSQQNNQRESFLDPNLMVQVKKKEKETSVQSSVVAMWVIRGRAMIGLGLSIRFCFLRNLRLSLSGFSSFQSSSNFAFVFSKS